MFVVLLCWHCSIYAAVVFPMLIVFYVCYLFVDYFVFAFVVVVRVVSLVVILGVSCFFCFTRFPFSIRVYLFPVSLSNKHFILLFVGFKFPCCCFLLPMCIYVVLGISCFSACVCMSLLISCCLSSRLYIAFMLLSSVCVNYWCSCLSVLFIAARLICIQSCWLHVCVSVV